MTKKNYFIYDGLGTGTNSSVIDATDGDDIVRLTADMSSYYNASTRISTGAGSDFIRIGGKMTGYGSNLIQMGDGAKEVVVVKGMDAKKGAYNTISAGDGAHNFTIGSLESKFHGQNTIKTGNGADTISVTGSVWSVNAKNVITLGEGEKKLSFADSFTSDKGGINEILSDHGYGEVTFNKDMKSSDNGVNRVHLGDGGSHNINIKGKLISNGGLNEILTGNENDTVTISGGVSVNCGGNRVNTGAGDDHVIISGAIKGGFCDDNIVELGSGNDVLELRGRVARGGLTIDAGEGDDTLILHAKTTAEFNSFYGKWLTDCLASSDEPLTNLEVIRLDVDLKLDPSKVKWLTELVSNNNQEYPDQKIKLEFVEDGKIITLVDPDSNPQQTDGQTAASVELASVGNDHDDVSAHDPKEVKESSDFYSGLLMDFAAHGDLSHSNSYGAQFEAGSKFDLDRTDGLTKLVNSHNQADFGLKAGPESTSGSETAGQIYFDDIFRHVDGGRIAGADLSNISNDHSPAPDSVDSPVMLESGESYDIAAFGHDGPFANPGLADGAGLFCDVHAGSLNDILAQGNAAVHVI